VFDLHSAMKTHVICETRRLETVNEDFEDVEKGRVQARLVFEMD
jgi:propanol-preferring alcohol dehydrogenase